jgi:hypothetical protein
VSSHGGHVAASPAAWLSVTLVVLAFVAGTFALIASSVVLWIVTGVLAVAGLVVGFTSKIMEQAY